jgi:hypothetical protein
MNKKILPIPVIVSILIILILAREVDAQSSINIQYSNDPSTAFFQYWGANPVVTFDTHIPRNGFTISLLKNGTIINTATTLPTDQNPRRGLISGWRDFFEAGVSGDVFAVDNASCTLVKHAGYTYCGVSVSSAHDVDGDAIPEDIDLCPAISGPVLNSGCPDVDGDGLMEDIDECPFEAGREVDYGCPLNANIYPDPSSITQNSTIEGQTQSSFRATQEAIDRTYDAIEIQSVSIQATLNSIGLTQTIEISQLISTTITATPTPFTGESRVLSPREAVIDDFILIRLELEPSESNVATAIPPIIPESAPTPQLITRSDINLYPLMGAELGGLDIENFEVVSLLTESMLHVRPNTVNVWEWYLRANGPSAVGVNYLTVTTYQATILEDGTILKQNFIPQSFEITINEATNPVLMPTVYAQPTLDYDSTEVAQPIDSANAMAQAHDIQANQELHLLSQDVDLTVVYADNYGLYLVVRDVVDLSSLALRSERSEHWLGSIDGLSLTNYIIEPNWCIRFFQFGTQIPFLHSCNRSMLFSEALLTVEMFWYDPIQDKNLNLALVDLERAENITLAVCNANNLICDIDLPNN